MILVIGTFRVPADKLGALATLAETVVTTTRAEDGCIAYSYAPDLYDAGLIHVVEKWRDRAALDAHARSAHMQTWVKERVALDLSDRAIRVFESDEGVAI
jgi:quinol monooxygenase YgiN